MEILVFKTNIRFKKNLTEVVPHLNKTKGILRWNLDFHDKDKILRIEATNLHPQLVESILQNAGFSCEELTN